MSGKAFYASGKLELSDAGASGGLMFEIRTSTADGRGEESSCVELEHTEVASLERALRAWLGNKLRNKHKETKTKKGKSNGS
jgi:hypothetical protein